jgi:hypothetical protein
VITIVEKGRGKENPKTLVREYRTLRETSYGRIEFATSLAEGRDEGIIRAP